METIYFIRDRDREKYLKVLKEYFKYMEGKGEDEAEKLASSGYLNLVAGRDLNGVPIDNKNINYFDDVLNIVTKQFYKAPQSTRHKYPKGKELSGRKNKKTKDNTEPVTSTLTAKDKVSVERIRSNLITEYPNLDRIDLAEPVYNYCVLVVKLNKLMAGDVVSNNVAIKNLNDTLIKLGGYLGIDESLKAKQRAAEDRQSIAAMSVIFQQTIEHSPEIVERMRYKELRILMDKYNRGELTRILFELPSFAGCSIEDANAEINRLAKKYEGS